MNRALRLVLVLAALAAVAAALALYAARKVIAREVLVGWLRSKGVAADAQVEAFGLSGFTGWVRVGDPKAPDFTAARVQVGYRFAGLSPEVTSVVLRQPVVRARLHDGRLSAGALDPLIAEFRKRPPRPSARKPRVEVLGGVLWLTTDQGPVRLAADALVNDGKLVSLDATSAPTRLQGKGFDAELGAGRLRLRSAAGRAAVSLDIGITRGRAGALAATGARLQLTADAPYPDLERRRGEGALVVHGNLASTRLDLGAQTLDTAQLSAAFSGRATGWIPDLAVTGQATADLRAAAGRAGPARLEGLRAAATASDLAWTRKGGDAVRGGLRLTAALEGLAMSDLRLRRLSAALQGPLAVDRTGAVLRLTGDANGHGAWTGLGAPGPGDSADMAAVKRALRGFRFAAPGLTLTAGGTGPAAALAQPLRLLPDAGGEARLAPQGAGYRLSVAGGGLPRIEAEARRVRLVSGGMTAAGRIKAALSIGPIVDGVFDAAGELRVADGRASFAGERCAAVQAGRLEFGANDVTALKGQLCPAGGPLLALGQGDWRIAGRAQAASAEVPFLQARIEDAAGQVELGQVHGALAARMRLDAARVEDLARDRRFRPLELSGQAGLANDEWRAELAARLPNGPAVGSARLAHDTGSGRGGVAIDTGLLTFTERGLQPVQLSPLAKAVGSPAEGSARFAGRFDWTPAGVTSGGVLHVPRLDFLSPAGRVTGLSGDVEFVNLAPLTTAPGQVLRAREVAAFAPLTGAAATFALDAEALTISGGEAAVNGGRARIETLEAPLAKGRPVKGVLDLEGVQLHDLVEASPFGDQMDLDAKVSGRVPFEVQDGKVRVLEGRLRAIQPGRLSIRRTALTSVTASGAIAAPAGAPAPKTSTDTVTDFAYQAMENLAFDTLEATVDSRPDGRLGVLFHIAGRHDPPKRQELTLTWWELIRRDFMNRKLPLPSGTEVNLTLDTTLNLDDLLKDYADYQRLRSSPVVQP